MPISVDHLSQSLAAEIPGIDLSGPLDSVTVAQIRDAWLDNLVLLFRGQSLSGRNLIDFSRHIGELGTVPGWEDFHVPGFPEVLVISNVNEGGEPIGVLGAGEAAWHTDMSYLPDPPMASLLHAIEVPETGGDTCFMNMYDALAALTPPLRDEFSERFVNHDDRYSSNGQLRPGRSAVDDVSLSSGTRHRAILEHPETERSVLYLGRRLNAYVVGETVESSEALLDEIWAQIEQADIVYRHHWQAGDVLLWDNRCTMHRRDPFDASERRVMHRTQIL